ncbi:outer membrane protein assembly factor BamE [Yunchengibacter salinarum]|uniref:outer membrane protein assembly factor BamE n=1 Tax=Yunchengibacter salinarum TaxID=3133399 RepID=UPI0035B63351
MTTTPHFAAAMKPLLLAGCAALVLGACSDRRMSRGYIFDEELAGAIQPGVDNERSVQSTLGTPTLKSAYREGVWYYVSTKVRTRPVFFPDAKEHRVMAVRFADNGTVANVNNYDLADMKHVEPVGGKTPTRGREMGFFQQIFMNFGRFSGQAPVGSAGGGPNGSRLPGPNGS